MTKYSVPQDTICIRVTLLAVGSHRASIDGLPNEEDNKHDEY